MEFAFSAVTADQRRVQRRIQARSQTAAYGKLIAELGEHPRYCSCIVVRPAADPGADTQLPVPEDMCGDADDGLENGDDPEGPPGWLGVALGFVIALAAGMALGRLLELIAKAG